MRLTGQVRRTQGLSAPQSVDSTYKPVERPARNFNSLKISRKLQASLPYASKPKLMKTQSHRTYLQRRAVVLEPEERKALAMMQQIRAIRKDQVSRRRGKQDARKEVKRAKMEKEEAKKVEIKKDGRKEAMRMAGIKSKREVEREEGGSRKRRKT